MGLIVERLGCSNGNKSCLASSPYRNIVFCDNIKLVCVMTNSIVSYGQSSYDLVEIFFLPAYVSTPVTPTIASLRLSGPVKSSRS